MKKIITIIPLCFILFSCTDPSMKEQDETAAMVVDTSSSCPFLTSDDKGNTVLSWVKKINDSTNIICYAIYNEGKFNTIIEIPSGKNIHPHGENMPKIVFKPSGEIIAVWGTNNSNPKNKYSGLVFYTQSFDEGKTWSNATPLVTDTSSYDQRYFDIVILSNGEAAIIWLDNRKKIDTEGSTLYFASTNGKNGFENEKAICESICQCCRTDLFVDNKNNIHATFRDIINDSIRDMVHTFSSDEGKTFSSSQRISVDNWVINGCPHTGPAIAESKKGLHFAWYTLGGGQGVFYCSSADNGKTFSIRDSVSGKASAKHPQIITDENDDVVIVWDEVIQQGENYNSRIGLQKRNAAEKTIHKDYITPDSLNCVFPVLKAMKNNSILVAYTRKDNKAEQVVYQIIK
ncbi:MAG: sialidase family protein [Bacteroidota bacterium]